LFYGYFRDPYYLAFRIAKNHNFEDDYHKDRPPANMTKELTIDIILLTNIIFCALTTYRKENSQQFEKSLKNILWSYCVEGSMVFDVLSVVPTLATNQASQRKAVYCFKLIRFLKIGKTFKAIKGATKRLIQQTGFSKGIVEQANNIISMIIITCQTIHILSTIWVGLAKMSTCSWIEQGMRDLDDC
jgi:hypothetical protein